MKIEKQPNNLKEAIEILYEMNPTEHGRNFIKNKTESEFLGLTHHSYGQIIRNQWLLWWYPENKNEGWPKEKPKIVKFFNDLAIVHADDMSSIILKSFYRSITGSEVDLDGQVEHYKNYWRSKGFPDGIPKTH